MEKFLKNPLYQGIMILLILVVVVAWMWDGYKNSNKNFYGLLNKTPQFKPNFKKKITMANERVSKALGERFSFSIANTSGATKVIAILAAFFDTLAITLAEGTPNTAVLSYNSAAKIVAAGDYQ